MDLRSAAEEMLLSGQHEGPCDNDYGEACDIHAKAHKRRQANLREALGATYMTNDLQDVVRVFEFVKGYCLSCSSAEPNHSNPCRVNDYLTGRPGLSSDPLQREDYLEYLAGYVRTEPEDACPHGWMTGTFCPECPGNIATEPSAEADAALERLRRVRRMMRAEPDMSGRSKWLLPSGDVMADAIDAVLALSRPATPRPDPKLLARALHGKYQVSFGPEVDHYTWPEDWIEFGEGVAAEYERLAHEDSMSSTNVEESTGDKRIR